MNSLKNMYRGFQSCHMPKLERESLIPTLNRLHEFIYILYKNIKYILYLLYSAYPTLKYIIRNTTLLLQFLIWAPLTRLEDRLALDDTTGVNQPPTKKKKKVKTGSSTPPKAMRPCLQRRLLQDFFEQPVCHGARGILWFPNIRYHII